MYIFVSREEYRVKYIVQTEISAKLGAEVEANPAMLQEVVGAWQALKPIGMYFSLTRRSVTVIVDVPNEGAMFEALHKTWVMAKSYPAVTPVVSGEEFPALLQRAGVGH